MTETTTTEHCIVCGYEIDETKDGQGAVICCECEYRAWVEEMADAEPDTLESLGVRL